MRADQERKRTWSSAGTPSISQMISTGNGRASSATTSMPPRSAARSRMSSTIRSIRGRSCSTRWGVNARLTRPRRRVWSGGSRKRKLGTKAPASCSGGAAQPGFFLKSLLAVGLRSTVMQSS